MFLNQRSRRTAALVVAVFLLAALPAAAAGSGKPQTQAAAKQAGGIWEGLLAQVLAWVGSPWSGISMVAGADSSANIDPLGQH